MARSGSPDWGGSRLVTGEQSVIAVASFTLAPGASQSYTVGVTRPSYLVRAFFQNITDAITVVPVQVDMQWGDIGTGVNIDRQRWNIFAGDNANPHFIFGRGPCRGDTLTLTITNQAPSVATLQYELFVIETGQYDTWHDWRSDDFTAIKIPTFGQPLSDNLSDVIVILDHAPIPATTTLTWALPLFCGPCILQFHATGATGNDQAWILNGSDVRFNANATLFTQTPIQDGGPPVQLFLPRSQAYLQIQNFSAATITRSCSLIAGTVP